MTGDRSTLLDLLDPESGPAGDAIAAIFGEEGLTFAELRERASRVAGALRHQGVRAGDVVAVWLTNCPAWVELQFALAQLGALFVCVNSRYRSHELGGVLSQSRPRWLVLQTQFRGIDFPALLGETTPEQRQSLHGVIVHGAGGAVPPLDAPRVIPYEPLRQAAPLDPTINAATPERPCVAFASSGSTGVPKLIVHTQRTIADHARSVALSFFDYDDAVALVSLPLSGVFGYVTFMGAAAAGCPSVVMDAFDAAHAVELIERHRVTMTTGQDEMMQRILDAADPPSRIASWREGGYGAQAVDSDRLIAQGDEHGVELFQCYGSSECLGLTSRQPRGAPPSERRLGGGVPVSPLTEVRARSVDTGELLPAGEPGLIEVRGPSVMSGYLNRRDLTAAAFTDDGWFRTGDIGYRVGTANRFVFLTRNNDVLRLAGFLVEPREIEQFIESLDGVASAQVVEVMTPRGARAAAFVIPRAGADPSESEVVEYCTASLAKYKVPARVFVVDAFPTTPSANGDKVHRAELRRHAQERLADTARA